ncbi:G-type lectin S-receptor-like serine/threonine-protein kinase LECRK2 [Gossypium hirsutum]|uniref:G-type lectin S-receptor-like serine/threonine-protein kinase LECRK2 n=1 Tax=Gossypium hirsutum TaxID=3635 RepID=A0A1U8MYZ1_GOSHI|nr:G-type lectin S-receptor-like serine/threonine-protein kinase LECRK2 [Gossypium hirsutum]
MHPPVLRSFSLLLCVAIQVFVAFQTTNISSGSSTVASEDSPPWHSPSKEFAFEFCRINNQNIFLLAIWFDTIPDKTIVRYPKQQNPAPEGSKLELSVDGQFTLTTPQGQKIWKPTSVFDKFAYAAMLNTRNFILVGKDFSPVWESFGEPATILPMQVMELGG